MKNWYRNMAGGQKTFLYVISVVMIVVGLGTVLPISGVGLVLLLVLIFLQLGEPKKEGSSHR